MCTVKSTKIIDLFEERKKSRSRFDRALQSRDGMEIEKSMILRELEREGGGG